MPRHAVPHPTAESALISEVGQGPVHWEFGEHISGNALVPTRCPDKYRVFPDDEKPLTFAEACEWWRHMQATLGVTAEMREQALAGIRLEPPH